MAVLFTLASAHADTTALWNNTTGNWTDAARWTTNPVFPHNAPPDFYDVTINAGAVTLDQAIQINQLSLGGGALDGAFALSAAEGLVWSGGTIRGAGTLTLAASGTSAFASAGTLVLNARTIEQQGLATFSTGILQGGAGATLRNAAGATFTALNQAAFFVDPVNPAWTFDNAGTFIARSTTGDGFTSMDATFHNRGAVRVEVLGGASHTLQLAGGGTHSGSFSLAAQTTLVLGGATILQSGAGFTGAGALITAGEVIVAGSLSASNLTVAFGSVALGSQTVSVSGGVEQLGGVVSLGGGTLSAGGGAGTFLLSGGSLTGTGMLHGGLETHGEIAPGAALGSLSVSGAAAFGEDARLTIEIGGAGAGSFDVLQIGGPALLEGEVAIRLANGFRPSAADSFSFLTAGGGVAGVFANAPLDGARFATVDGLGSFVVHYAGNSVFLTNFMVPEPVVAIELLAGLPLVACGRFRPRPGAR